MRRVSSGLSGDIPEIFTGTSLPATSTTGKLPGEKMRSLAFSDVLSIASRSAGMGTVFGSDVGLVWAGAVAVCTRSPVLWWLEVEQGRKLHVERQKQHNGETQNGRLSGTLSLLR